MAIAKATLRKDVFDTIFTIITTNITDKQSPARVADDPLEGWVTGENNKVVLDELVNLSKYPIITLSTVHIVDFADQNLGRDVAIVKLSIDITVFSQISRFVTEIHDEIKSILRTNKASYQADGLFIDIPFIDEDRTSFVQRGKVTLHMQTTTYNFMFGEI